MLKLDYVAFRNDTNAIGRFELSHEVSPDLHNEQKNITDTVLIKEEEESVDVISSEGKQIPKVSQKYSCSIEDKLLQKWMLTHSGSEITGKTIKEIFK